MTTTTTSGLAVASDGVRVAYDHGGSGEVALLYLPGWCSNRTTFTPLLDAHRSDCAVLALDWRGHGQSENPPGDFGLSDLVEDALAVVDTAGVERVVPVALAHAGFVALELVRVLGDRVAAVVVLDWMVLGPATPFLEALDGLQDPARWREVRDAIIAMWRHGVDLPALDRHLAEMEAYGPEMWGRGAREIARCFRRDQVPLDAFASCDERPPVLHLYAQPRDPDFLAAQQAYADAHYWFAVQRLDASTHFPMFEVASEMASAIEAVLDAVL